MTAPIEPSIEQIEGADRAAEAASTKTMAQSIAAAVAESAKLQPGSAEVAPVIDPNTPLEDLPGVERDLMGNAYPTPDAEVVPGEPEADPAAAAAEGALEEIIEEMTPEDLTALEQSLQAAGISLGTKITDLPQEAQSAYLDALEQVQVVVQDVVEREASTREQQMAMDEFAKKLEESPDKVLLAIALSNPEVFTQVAEVIDAANSDPKVKDLIMRELSTDAKLAEVDRRDRAFNEREHLAKARTVVAATKRSAQTHGVPFPLAEKVVAMAVQANGGDLDVADVDAIVVDLKGAGVAPTARRVRRVVTPAAQAAAAAAAQPAPAPATPAGTPELSPGLEEGKREGSGGLFRGLVRNAARRVIATQRQ